MLAICVLVPCAVHAQRSWERDYGGPDHDYGRSAQQTSDGGYIMAGYTNSFGDSSQVYLVKTNASGDTLWTRTYGGVSNDCGYSAQQTSDGGYIVAGYTYSFGDGSQVYLVKTNASGDGLWTKNFGGAGFDAGNSVRQTLDGGYIVTGATASFGNGQQVYLVKTDSSGDTLWTRVFGGAYLDVGYTVEQTKDGGYIIAGTTSSFGTSFEVYLIKTDAAGDTVWTRTYGGTEIEFGSSAQQTSDSGYIVTGYSTSYGDSNQVYLVKTNSSGDTMWTRTYGGARNDYGSSVQQAEDGGYIVAGYTYSYGAGDRDAYLIKTDAYGDTLWTRTYGGTDADGANSVRSTSDGGHIVAGYSASLGGDFQAYLIRTDPEGLIGIAQTPSADVRTRNAWPTIVRGVLHPSGPGTRSELPGNSVMSRAALLDAAGRKVLDLHGGANDVSALAPGVYFVRTETGSAADRRRVILQ
jgi:hypothetical protein